MRIEIKENATFQIMATAINFALILVFNGDIGKAIAPALGATALMPVLYHANWWMWSRRRQYSVRNMRVALKENATFQIMATALNFALILVFNGDIAKAIVPALVATVLILVIYHANWWMWSRHSQGSASRGGTSETHPNSKPQQ